MRASGLLTVVFAAAALTGCATHPAHKDPPNVAATGIIPTTTECNDSGINTDSCVIRLTVSDHATNVKDCVIKLKMEDNDLLTVKGMVGKYIYWRIVESPDYIFTKDGISFIDNFRPRKFDEGERIDAENADDRQGYQWRVLDGKRRVNGYVINVRKGIRRCELDPWVRSK